MSLPLSISTPPPQPETVAFSIAKGYFIPPQQQKEPEASSPNGSEVIIINPDQSVEKLYSTLRMVVRQAGKVRDTVVDVFRCLMTYEWDPSESELLLKIGVIFNELSGEFQGEKLFNELFNEWTTFKWLQIKRIDLSTTDEVVIRIMGLWSLDCDSIQDIDEDLDGCHTSDNVLINSENLRLFDCDRFNNTKIKVSAQFLIETGRETIALLRKVQKNTKVLELKYLYSSS